MDNTTAILSDSEPSSRSETVIVGIGASAGGIEALTEFFKQVQPKSGMAYVVILHLSPDYDSQLTRILQDVARLPVSQVTETVTVEADHIYVVPPNKHLQMEEGNITVHQNTTIEERRAPVDIFLRTLAESHGTHAIAVILSGTGANGSMGLKRVKENGGGVFVQNPQEATFSEMPRHAIATDLVDDVLPVGQIPARLLTYCQSLGTITIPLEAQERPEDQQQALREVFTQLRLRTGHDFSNYKRPTLFRRLARRIHVRKLPNLPAYVTYLRENPDEVQALLKDLLISVTNFFRDSRVFAAFEHEVLPVLLAGKKGDDMLRIWVAGCATGEEAYSLAILLAERTLGVPDAPKVQIFATDIDEDAIATAREGLYTLNDAADVAPEQLRRFFTREGDDYRIRREIREMVLFAHHNMLKDPPFSRLDMVSCRNVLIYLNQTAQERVMETFHFALNAGGFLLLGTSETVDGSNDLYTTTSREHHIYRSRQVSSRPYPVPESIPTFPLERLRIAEPTPEPESHPPLRLNYADLHQQLLEQYAAPSVIVNEEYDILHVSERAGRYLHIAGGEPTKNLLKLVRPELRLELRTALYQATQRQTNVSVRNLPIRIDDQLETITIQVRPVLRQGDPAFGFILVLFEPTVDDAGEPDRIVTSVEPVAQQLEEELMRVKAQLRSSNEHYELQAEEMKASNEELQAMNEELRSAAEELETSKEELQSLNEELITVNQELKVKVEEISITTNNLQNLVNSTDIATLFLDRRLRVKLFTPATRQLFNLIPTDSGRPLTDITNRLVNVDLPTEAERVLDKLQPVEREVQTNDGRAYIMRLLLYRTADDHINGVVVTFVNITERKADAETLRASEEQLSAIVNQTTAGIARTNIDGTMTFVNQRYHELLGYEIAEILGATMQQFTHPDDLAGNLVLFNRLGETGEPFEIEKRYIRKDGSVVWVQNNVSALYDSEGKITQLLAVTVDITGRKQAEAYLRESEEKYRTLFESIDEGVAIVEVFPDEQGRVADMIWREANQGVERHTGGLNFLGKKASEIVPNLESHWLDAMTGVYQTGEPVRMEAYIADLDRWIETYYSRVGGSGSPLMASVFQDVTERKRHEQRQEFLLKLSDALRTYGSVADLQNTACQLLAQQLGAARVNYAEVEGDQYRVAQEYRQDGLLSMVGQYPIDSFRPAERAAFEAGRTVVIADMETELTLTDEEAAAYAALNARSFVSVPLVRAGQWVVVLSAIRAQPGPWWPNEVRLVEETAERTWTAVEQAKAEAALRETEQRLASIRPLTLLSQTEALAKIGSWEYNQQTGQFNWSDGMYKLFELDQGQPIQPNIYLDFAVDEDQPKAQRLVTYLRSGKGHFETDFRIRVGEQIKTLRIKADVVSESDQQRVLGVDLDISDQLAAQQQIQQTAENLQAVLDGSPAAIGLLKTVRDPADVERIIDFRLAVGNRKLAEFFKKPLEKLLGQSAERFSKLLWDGHTLAVLRQVRLTGEARYDEQQLPKEGRWLAIATTRQDDGVLVTALDISELKNVQEQQQRWLGEVEASRQSVDALQALRDSLSHRSELLRSVSHDLRGNFGIISGALQLLSMAASEAERTQMMDMVLRNVQQATGLLTELLDFSRLETGQQQRSLQPFDAAILLTELSQSLQSAADEQGLQLASAGPQTLAVEGDRTLVYRMAQNLTINAIKYTQRGSVTVNWGEDRLQGRWWFSVSDTGPGLDADLVANLNMNPDNRTESAASPTSPSNAASAEETPDTSDRASGAGVNWTKLRGEGIGLRIVRQLAYLLEAQLQVSSEAGVGTRFVVSFPLRYS